jgi:hypothetical protein
MKLLLAILLASASLWADDPRIVYTKFFKGSVPEYVNITVEHSGKVVYKEAVDDERPIQFEVSSDQAAELFGLAEKLNRFSRPLESPAKVAHMGFKTFRYEEGAAATETKFNFTEDADGRTLADWFDRVIETEQDYINLERTVKFDKLGVNQVLLQLQVTLERKRLVAPQQFLPLLDRIIKNESFMHMSRERASALADTFRNPPKTDKKAEQ